jgi:hypothetical protein
MGSDRGADRPDDPGAAEPVFYFVEDGILSMCDENGKPTGKGTALGPDNDPRRVAGRLKLAALNERPDFNRRLNYQPLGVA